VTHQPCAVWRDNENGDIKRRRRQRCGVRRGASGGNDILQAVAGQIRRCGTAAVRGARSDQTSNSISCIACALASWRGGNCSISAL